MREMEFLAKREGNIVKKPSEELIELGKEDMEFLEDNEIIKKINSLFMLDDENRNFRYLMGKLVYARFVMKYLVKYSEIVGDKLDLKEFSLQQLFDENSIKPIHNSFNEQKEDYIFSSFTKIIIELSDLFDVLNVKSMEDLVLLSNISDIQNKMIENVKDEDIFWLYETINQFKRKLVNLNMLEIKPCIEIRQTTKVIVHPWFGRREKIPEANIYEYKR